MFGANVRVLFEALDAEEAELAACKETLDIALARIDAHQARIKELNVVINDIGQAKPRRGRPRKSVATFEAHEGAGNLPRKANGCPENEADLSE